MDERTVELIETHMGLAQSLARQEWRKAPHALDLDELRSIAYLGLVGAADRWWRYCEEKGYSPDALVFFKQFVVRRVKGAIIDAIRSADWATRSLRTRAKALQEAGQDKGLSHQELAERTGLTLDEVRSTVRGMAQRPVSIEAEDIDVGAPTDVESSVLTNAILGAVVATVGSLPDEEQVVIALHYHGGLQLQEVAKTLGVTESRASQLHAKAVLAIHEAMLTTAHQRD